MSKNKLRAETILTISGNEYKAKMSIDTISNIEEALNLSIFAIGKKLSSADLKLREVTQIMYYAIRAGGSDISENDVKKMLSEIGIIESIKIAGQMIALALQTNSDDTEVDTEKK